MHSMAASNKQDIISAYCRGTQGGEQMFSVGVGRVSNIQRSQFETDMSGMVGIHGVLKFCWIGDL